MHFWRIAWQAAPECACAGEGLETLHRRLSGDEEVAALPESYGCETKNVFG